MKKQLIITGIIAILLAVGLSGCNETKQRKNYGSNIELVNDHYITEEYYLTYTERVTAVNGTIRSLAGDRLIKVEIRLLFYDSNGSYLTSGTTYVYDIINLEEKDFTYYMPAYWDQYDEIDWDNVKFQFAVPYLIEPNPEYTIALNTTQ